MPKQSSPKSPDDNYLTITVDDFKAKLKTQINEGNTLVSKVQAEPFANVFQGSFKEWNEYNFEFLKQSFNSPMNDQTYNYNHAGYSFMGPLGEVTNDPSQTLLNAIDYKLANLNSLLKRADLFKSKVVNLEPSQPLAKKQMSASEVFVVHGHDDLAKVSVARFIEKLGLKAIILHEQHNAGMTLIEKIENYTNVGFAVVLYTECDLGGKDANNLQPRARQNVVFEHGYLMAKIGRNKVCALVKGKVETPSDISGVVYTPMDEHGAWHYMLAKELKASGYDIDMNRL